MGHVNFRQDLYNWDNEDNILNFMQLYVDNNVKFLNNNDFEKQILDHLKNYLCFTANNGHDCPPPDYYSDSLDCMFDVLRINATEETYITKKNKIKTKNPEKSKEREIAKFYESVGFFGKPYCHTLIDVPGEPSFDKYLTQARRTINDHISKIPLWEQEHPMIKTKGLIICDESPLCIEGTKRDGIIHYDPDTFRIHEAWNDIEFSLPIYKSDLDFVVWFSPSKWGSKFIYNHNQNHDTEINYYPPITIADTRNPRKRFRSYDYNQLIFV